MIPWKADQGKTVIISSSEALDVFSAKPGYLDWGFLTSALFAESKLPLAIISKSKDIMVLCDNIGRHASAANVRYASFNSPLCKVYRDGLALRLRVAEA